MIVGAFAAGAALSAGPAFVALLWPAVVASFAWLLTASATLNRVVLHPNLADRAQG